MSKTSNSSQKNTKAQETKRINNEQVLASLMALPVVALDQDAPLQDIKLQAKNKTSGLIDFDSEKELTELEGLVVDPVGSTELALGDEALIDLALIEDSEYSNASKKEDDDDEGVAWWLKGLALLGGGAAAFAGGGGGGGSPSAGPAQEYDHLSFIDDVSGGDGDDVLVLDSGLTAANLTLIAPENQQTFDSSGGSGGLLDENANSQYVFVGENSGARTLNLRVSDEDNIALGLFLDADLDLSGGHVYSESVLENVNILVDSNSILNTAEQFSGAGAPHSRDLISNSVDGRNFSVEVIENSELNLENNFIDNIGNDVNVAISADSSDINSGWSLIVNSSDSLNVSIDLANNSTLNASNESEGVAVVESYGDDLTVNINLDSSDITAAANSGGSDDSIVYSEGDRAAISLTTNNGSSIFTSGDVIDVEGSNSTITVNMTDSNVGISGGFGGKDTGAIDFVHVDAYDQIDTETTFIDTIFTGSELNLDDDLIDFNGEKLDVALQITNSGVAVEDSILEVDSSSNVVIASVVIEDSLVTTNYGNFIDIHDAKNLDLTLTIDSSLILTELAYSDGFFGIDSGGFDGVLNDIDLFKDVSLINVDNGPLTNLNIELSATSSTLFLDQHFINVSTNQIPANSESTISLTFDSVFAVTGDDAIAVIKDQANVDVDLHNTSGYSFLGYTELVPFSVTFTGDDFIDLAGDDSVINVNISDRPIGELGESGMAQIHFVSDDFIDIAGRDAQVTFNIQGSSGIALGEGFSISYLADIDGPGAHSFNFTMSDSSIISNGEDIFSSGGFFSSSGFFTSGGFFSSSGGSYDTGLVKIDNEIGDDNWDGSNDAVVNIELSDNAIIDAQTAYFSGGTDFMYIDSSNAKVSVILNDESHIENDGNLIYVNTNLYNSANYSLGSSDISLVINDEADVNSDISLIEVDYEHTNYVGQDLDDTDVGYGYATSTTVGLTLDGGESSGGAYAYAGQHLMNITDDDGQEDNDNNLTHERLDRNVNLSLSNAEAQSDNDSIRLQDLVGFNVLAELEVSSTIDTEGALIRANNVSDSYVELNITDESYVWLRNESFYDSLVFLDDSNDMQVVINIEDSRIEQGYDDTVSIFSGEDSSGLEVDIRTENLRSGEDYLQVVNIENVNDSVFNVDIYQSIHGLDDLYFDMGYDNSGGLDYSSDNTLNIRLVDTQSLEDVYINTNGISNSGAFNTVNLDLQETEADDVYINQSFYSSGYGNSYLMTTTVDLERSSMYHLDVVFDDLDGSADSENQSAELYINLNNSEINDAAMDVYQLDNVDLYTQGTGSSFIELDVSLMEDVDVLNVYSLGNSNFDYAINYSTSNGFNLYDERDSEQDETVINLAADRNNGARNYDYLDIEDFEMAQVNNFETAAGRDKIYNAGDFIVYDLDSFVFTSATYGNTDGDGDDTEEFYNYTRSAGVPSGTNTTRDDYYFVDDLTLSDLLTRLRQNDYDSDATVNGDRIESIGDRLDDGLGNTYYVINGGFDDNDVEIYKWVNDYDASNDNDFLSHVMTINGMNSNGIVDSSTELFSFMTQNQYHII